MKRKSMLLCLLLCFSLYNSASVNALDLNAFGDITFGDSSKDNTPDNTPPGSTSGFRLGHLDLWGTQIIDDAGKTKTFFELVIESPGTGFVVDLERLWVEYSIIPELKIRGGRFHTSMGYWNRSFHHGSHMQTTISRPLFLEFEDAEFGILPTHMIGLMGVADYEYGIGEIHLEIQIGNGTSYTGPFDKEDSELDPNNVGDVDDSKGIATRLVFSPNIAEGSGIGISYINNPVKYQLDTKNVYKSLVDQTIIEADLFYLENNVEFILEYYSITNKDTRINKGEHTTHTSTAWYVQAGYTLFETLTPYARYEFFDDLDKHDSYFNDIGLNKNEYTQIVYGARFDINSNSSIKIEASSITDNPGNDNESDSSSYSAQWTFAF